MWRSSSTDCECGESGDSEHKEKSAQTVNARNSTDCECKETAAQTVNTKKHQHRLWMQKNSSTDFECEETSAQTVNTKKQHWLWIQKNISTRCECKETSARAVNAKKQQHISTDCECEETTTDCKCKKTKQKTSAHTVNLKKHHHRLNVKKHLHSRLLWRICTDCECEATREVCKEVYNSKFGKRQGTRNSYICGRPRLTVPLKVQFTLSIYLFLKKRPFIQECAVSHRPEIKCRQFRHCIWEACDLAETIEMYCDAVTVPLMS